VRERALKDGRRDHRRYLLVWRARVGLGMRGALFIFVRNPIPL
jgi:hypothetical protein